MSLKHKYRIIGVIVLIVAVVTLLPSFFKHREQVNHSIFDAIPTEPTDSSNISNVVSDDPSNTQAIATVNESEPSAANNTVSEATPITQGYVIELGKFMDEHYVDEIKAKLSLLNYHVYTIPTVPIVGKETRVLVGPYPTKEQALSVIETLKQTTQLEGQLIKFNPLVD